MGLFGELNFLPRYKKSSEVPFQRYIYTSWEGWGYVIRGEEQKFDISFNMAFMEIYLGNNLGEAPTFPPKDENTDNLAPERWHIYLVPQRSIPLTNSSKHDLGSLSVNGRAYVSRYVPCWQRYLPTWNHIHKRGYKRIPIQETLKPKNPNS